MMIAFDLWETMAPITHSAICSPKSCGTWWLCEMEVD
jgi:hypothetical protein